jgi:hypothetical protein
MTKDPRAIASKIDGKEIAHGARKRCSMEESKFSIIFSDITDIRVDRTKRHKLLDIIGLTICAVLCGADNWVEVAEFREAREEWLKTFLELPNGIPSHDTGLNLSAALLNGSGN